MAVADGVLPDTIKPELKRNLDFSWFNNPVIRNDVKVKLETIKNNFRPHPNCWVRKNNFADDYVGWLVFPYDSPMTNSDMYTHFPDEYSRLLIAFKYWNIMHYFNPYNYILDTPPDSSLYKKILLIANAADGLEFYQSIKKMTRDLDDAHVEGLTWSNHMPWPNLPYSPPIILSYIQNKYVVVKTTLKDIKAGDAILSINGRPVNEIEDSLMSYISAGNSSVFHRFMCTYILKGLQGPPISIAYSDSAGNIRTLNTSRTENSSVNYWFYSYYPNDSLADVKWKKFSCNVGYINMGQLQPQDVKTMYSNLRTCSTIIFDVRNYPNGTAREIASLMYPKRAMFSKLTVPDVTYPGTFLWAYDYAGNNGNQAPYEGKVIILMNEQTQSHAEYSCMILENMERSIKIGSQTSGADGNISYFKLSNDIQVGYTSLGVYYPNGEITQRTGIQPDILISPTQAGIRKHRDEVLEKALEVAGCITSMPNLNDSGSTIKISPNPTIGLFYIETNSSNKQTIDLYDMNGKHVFSKSIKGSAEIDVTNLEAGVYNLIIRSGASTTSRKLVKIRG